MLNVGSHIFS
uniref:Uncharacterized protein n=1 Tax=Arundo donax TaxID=35708 RepID=A0A0A9B8S2_ARUDO